LDHLDGNFGGKLDADSTVEVFNLPDSDIFESGPNILNEALLEVVSIVSFKSKLMVMDDDASHTVQCSSSVRREAQARVDVCLIFVSEM